MISKWYELKPKALLLRKKGISLGDINLRLNIPKSTLSGWFKDVKLTAPQRKKLELSWKNGLVKARKKAVIWHNSQKNLRIKAAEDAASDTMQRLDFSDNAVIELALAMLYLGEGRKNAAQTSLGSSDPLILKFFIASLERSYNLKRELFKFELHLRADQHTQLTKEFWSQTLNVPMKNFTTVSKDKRTLGTKTYNWYNGVCVVNCGNAAVQRKLLFLSKMFCEKIYMGS